MEKLNLKMGQLVEIDGQTYELRLDRIGRPNAPAFGHPGVRASQGAGDTAGFGAGL